MALTLPPPPGSVLHLDSVFSRLPNFIPDIWNRYMSHLYTFASHPSAEVCSVSIECIGDLFSITIPRFPAALRDPCWAPSWGILTQFCTAAAQFPTPESRQKLAQSFEPIFSSLLPQFSLERADFQCFFNLFPCFCTPSLEPPVLKILLTTLDVAVIPRIPPSTFEDLILMLLRLIDRIASPISPPPAAFSPTSPPALAFSVAQSPFLTSLLQLLCSPAVFSAASLPIQAITFPRVIRSFASIMETKFHPELVGVGGIAGALWKEGVRSLVWLLEHHCAAISSIEESWHPLLSLFEGFLFPPIREDIRFEHSEEDTDTRIQLVQLLCATVLPHAPDVMVDRLLEIPKTGSACFETSERFAVACYRTMFQLCSGSNLSLTHRLVTMLIDHCRAILQGFLAASSLTLHLPMPIERIHEVTVILQELRDLQISAEVDLLSPNHALSFALRRSTRRHLFILLPVLSKCVVFTQPELRIIISEILTLISEELAFN